MYEDYKVGSSETNPGTPDDSSDEESSSDEALDQQEDFIWDRKMFDQNRVQLYITLFHLTMIHLRFL